MKVLSFEVSLWFSSWVSVAGAGVLDGSGDAEAIVLFGLRWCRPRNRLAKNEGEWVDYGQQNREKICTSLGDRKRAEQMPARKKEY